MTKQVGISPKVLNPLIVGAVVGLALVVAGLVADNNELLSAGLALILGAVGITGGVGYGSNPGTVVTKSPVAVPPAPAPRDRPRRRGGAGDIGP